MKEYKLNVVKDDPKYCNGCPILDKNNYCVVTGKTIAPNTDLWGALTPPICPLIPKVAPEMMEAILKRNREIRQLMLNTNDTDMPYYYWRSDMEELIELTETLIHDRE